MNEEEEKEFFNALNRLENKRKERIRIEEYNIKQDKIYNALVEKEKKEGEE